MHFHCMTRIIKSRHRTIPVIVATRALKAPPLFSCQHFIKQISKCRGSSAIFELTPANHCRQATADRCHRATGNVSRDTLATNALGDAVFAGQPVVAAAPRVW